MSWTGVLIAFVSLWFVSAYMVWRLMAEKTMTWRGRIVRRRRWRRLLLAVYEIGGWMMALAVLGFSITIVATFSFFRKLGSEIVFFFRSRKYLTKNQPVAYQPAE